MREPQRRTEQGIKRAVDCVVLAVLTVVVCLGICGTDRVFGSNVDWLSQHSVFPDYFRQQFYDTGDLFPEFAANIGGGQNIYNFSYYGLYSPVVLVSYLLPFMKMGDYLMAASVSGLAASVVLFYCWLGKRGISRGICFGTAVMFLLAGPMIFHSCRQVMFVNYMPFLCMGFLGADRYFERRKSGFLIVSVFLMIMTSFYFSICGMIVLGLYGISRYLEALGKNRVTVRGFLREGVRYGACLITAVMMSGILLVPTALALMGRSSSKGNYSLMELLCPKVRLPGVVYSAYGIGLTTLVITVLIAGLAGKRRCEQVLVYGCVFFFSVPVFVWGLNGGLYIRDKVLIPFLPLLCYLTACYLEEAGQGRNSFLRGFLPYLLTLGVLYAARDSVGNETYWKLIFFDGVVMAAAFLVFYRKRKVAVLLVPAIVFLALYTGGLYSSETQMVSKEDYERLTDGDIGAAVEKTVQQEEGFYRMEQMGSGSENGANINRIWDMDQYVSSVYSSACNVDYQKFRQKVFEADESFRNVLMQPVSRNPLLQKLMGVKYLVTYGEDEELPGYVLMDQVGKVKIYCNENVAPVAYATDRVIPEEAYRELAFPYNQLALMSYVAVEMRTLKETAQKEGRWERQETAGASGQRDEREIQKELETLASPAELSVPAQDMDGGTIRKTDSGYHIQSDKKLSVKAEIGKPCDAAGDRRFLFLQFQVENYKSSKDVGIWVEKEKNTLSADSHIYYNGNTVFTYAVGLEPGQDEAEIVFGKGDYEIRDLKCYVCPWKAAETEKVYQSEFYPDREHTKGNRISGSIRVEKDGYFITSIPYDDGFEIRRDGEEVPCEKVNTAFLGFPIEKGMHTVEMTYHAPGVLLGKVVSLLGIVILGGWLLMEKKIL